MEEKGWLRRHVIGEVVTALILFLAAFIWGWRPLWNLLTALLRWLGQPVSLPRWWYWTLTAALAITLLYRAFASRAFASRGSARPAWLKYREDVFWGVTWRWDYTTTDQIDTRHITPYCPRCDRLMEVEHEDWKGYSEAVCAPCGLKKRLQGPPAVVLDNVFREIDLKIRKNTFAKPREDPT